MTDDLDRHVDRLLEEKRRLTKRARASKRKGSGFERYVADLATQAGFPDARRNFGSGARGGNDLINVGELAIECKAREKLNVQAAYDQASAAARPTEIPVVAHKRNRCNALATLDLETFLALYKQATTGEGMRDPP